MPYSLDNFCREEAKKYPRKIPEDVIKVATVGALAGAIGNLVAVRLPSKFHVYVSLFSIVVGNSGKMKSPICSSAKILINSIVAPKFAKLKTLRERIESAQKEDPEAKIEDIPEGIPDRFIPFVSDDYTIEAMQEDAATLSDGNMFGFHDEFVGLLRAATKAGRETDISFFNKMYEHGPGWDSTRRKMVHAKIPIIRDPCLSLLGGLQPTAAERYMKHYREKGDGDAFFARFQNIFVFDKDSLPFQKPQAPDEEILCDIKNMMRKIIDQRILQSKLPWPDEENKDHCKKTYFYDLSPEAYDIWEKFYQECIEINDNSTDEMFKQYIDKTASFLLKISLIFHLIANQDQLFKDGKKISLRAMEKALEYVRERINHAQKFYFGNKTTGKIFAADASNILDYIKDSKTNFYPKYAITGWTRSNLERTNSEALPRLNADEVNRIKLDQILDYLSEEGSIARIDTGKTIIYLSKDSETINKMPYLLQEAISLPEDIDQQRNLKQILLRALVCPKIFHKMHGCSKSIQPFMNLITKLLNFHYENIKIEISLGSLMVSYYAENQKRWEPIQDVA